MDCRTALALLDCARPDSDDFGESELTAAAEHAETCANCLAIVRKREALDRRIGQVLRGAPVPEHFETRLLEALNRPSLASKAQHAAEPAEPRPRPSRRDRWRRLAFAASILLVVGAGIWGSVWLARPTLTLDMIIAELSSIESEDWKELPPFEGTALLTTLPIAWEERPVWFGSPPRGLPADASPHRMALYSFQAGRGRGELVKGLLVIVSRRSLAAPPQAAGLRGAPRDYIHSGGRVYAVVAWTSGDLVYVCGVEGGAENLETLERILEAPSA